MALPVKDQPLQELQALLPRARQHLELLLPRTRQRLQVLLSHAENRRGSASSPRARPEAAHVRSTRISEPT